MEPGTQRGAVVESWVAEVLKFDQSLVMRLSLWSEWQLLTSIGRFNDAGIFMSTADRIVQTEITRISDVERRTSNVKRQASEADVNLMFIVVG